MKFVLLTFFIVFSHIASGQLTTIIVQGDNLKPIPFVYILDIGKKIYLSSNEFGSVIIPYGSYIFQLTHVSYQSQDIAISSRSTDTTIYVILKEAEKVLEDVIIGAKRLINGKIRMSGVYNLNTGSTLVLYSALNIGLKCPAVRDISKYNVLTHIKFQSKKTSAEASKSLIIEIKIYGVEGDSLSANPINRIPIYLKASKLDGNVKIDLKERIVIPRGGLFLSFEIPPLDKIPVRVLAFTGSFESEIDFAYTRANKGLSWNVAKLKRYAFKNPYEPGKTFRPNLKIEYLEYEN